MARIGTVIREVYHRPGAGALPAHLEDRYGIKVTGTAKLTEGVFRVEHEAGPPWVARLMLTGRPVSRTEEDAEMQCWLACVSARVQQGFFPRREYITALANTVRAHSGRPA